MSFEVVLPYLFGAVFVIGGAVITVGAIRTMIQAGKVRAWPRAEGEILSTSIRSETHLMRTGSRIYGKSHTPIINYRYTIDGKQYKGNRIAITEYKGSRKTAESVLARHSKEIKTQVFFNSGNPEESFLEARAPGSLWHLALGLFCLSAGILALSAPQAITTFFTN